MMVLPSVLPIAMSLTDEVASLSNNALKSSVLMKYPAIRYSITEISNDHADDIAYKQKKAYKLTLIDLNPDSIYVDKILKLPYCRFDRYYPADNLNHYEFIIYY